MVSVAVVVRAARYVSEIGENVGGVVSAACVP